MVNKTMKQTFLTLSSLHALADWEAADAALSLAASQDDLASKQEREDNLRQQAAGLDAALAQETESGKVMNLGALRFLALQVRSNQSHLDTAHVELTDAKQHVSQAQTELASKRSRVDGLDKLKKKLKQQLISEQAKAEIPVLDDLVLANLWREGLPS